MDENAIKLLLEDVSRGSAMVSDAFERLRKLPFTDLGIAKYDHHRVLRSGFSEVVLCEGKRLEDILCIADAVKRRGENLLATRATEELAHHVRQQFPSALYDKLSRTLKFISQPIEPIVGRLALLCAGTADLPVAEEARHVAEFFGVETRPFYDVGIAGLPRLLSCVEEIRNFDVAIVVAGMEGALASVVGGLVKLPIIAVPTSVGYGVGTGGIASLISMLCSCSEGISVVNIDNGFGAACAAVRVLRCITRRSETYSTP